MPALDRISKAEANPFNNIANAIDVGIKGSGFGKNDIADSIAPKITVIPSIAYAAPMFWAAIGLALDNMNNAPENASRRIDNDPAIGIKGCGFGKNDMAPNIIARIATIPENAYADPIVFAEILPTLDIKLLLILMDNLFYKRE